jgi:hypothetical protein
MWENSLEVTSLQQLAVRPGGRDSALSRKFITPQADVTLIVREISVAASCRLLAAPKKSNGLVDIATQI